MKTYRRMVEVDSERHFQAGPQREIRFAVKPYEGVEIIPGEVIDLLVGACLTHTVRVQVVSDSGYILGKSLYAR